MISLDIVPKSVVILHARSCKIMDLIVSRSCKNLFLGDYHLYIAIVIYCHSHTLLHTGIKVMVNFVTGSASSCFFDTSTISTTPLLFQQHIFPNFLITVLFIGTCIE